MHGRGTRVWLCAALLAAQGQVFAQQQLPAQNSQYTAMLNAIIKSTKGRVLIFAPTISDLTLADAIRQTALDNIRNTTVRVVTIPYYNYTAKSAVLGLGLANVPIYEVQTQPFSSFVIVDNQGWKGGNLGTASNPDIAPMTATEINTSLRWYKNVVGKTKRMTQLEAFNRIKKVLK